MVIGGPRDRRLALALLGLVCGAAPQAQAQAQAPSRGSAEQSVTQPAQIDRNGTLILIRSTLIALQQANETGNYTVLRDLGAPGFVQANTAARLGEIFASLRAKNVDLAGVLVLDPQLTILPQIDNAGLMHMAGIFPSVPVQINFDLAFAPVNGRWRLFGVSVALGSSSPVAPLPPQQDSAAGHPPKARKAEVGDTGPALPRKLKRKVHPAETSGHPSDAQPPAASESEPKG